MTPRSLRSGRDQVPASDKVDEKSRIGDLGERLVMGVGGSGVNLEPS